jgi:hypothetical protein
VPEEIMRATPFGMAKQTSTKDGAAPVDPAKAFKSIDVETVLSQVSADRKSVKLKAAPGSSENVTITSKMPGTIQLQLGQTAYPGFEVKLDRTELKEGEKAVVSFRSVSGKKHAAAPVRVVVLPTNQPIDIQVLFE